MSSTETRDGRSCLGLLPRYDLHGTIGALSGGYRIRNDTKVQALVDRLDNSPYSAMEYCWFVVHFPERGHYEKLCYVNFLTQQSTWEAFEKFKARLPKEIRIDIDLQFKNAAVSIQNFGVERTLMENIAELTPPVKVEVALRMESAGFDPAPVFEAFGRRTWEQVLGNPEYLVYLDHLREAIRTQDARLWCHRP